VDRLDIVTVCAMQARRLTILLAGVAFAGSACSASIDSGNEVAAGQRSTTTTASSVAPSTDRPASVPPTTGAPTTLAPTTTVAPTTTTPEPVYFDPDCVVVVEEFDSLGLIADRFDDETVNVVALRTENNLLTADIDVGQAIDVCVGNGLDDITGEQRTDPDAEIVSAAVKQNIEVQQLKLNKLFEAHATPPLLVDGVSGPVTRQRLCAARLSLGLPASTADMAAGSAEEKLLLAATELAVPQTSATASTRWILIDRTCQIMFTGSGSSELALVFPTSTGSEGYETRVQERSSAFRFDPAIDNGGWHDSSDFPVAIDNPLNGNMYRPLYFDGGQAIHGANNVPTSPQSKGCARLRVEHQDVLIDWLGLSEARTPIWSEKQIAVTVNVQGDYQG
jgi:hypothetical protein